jgi:hypothetical protein
MSDSNMIPPPVNIDELATYITTQVQQQTTPLHQQIVNLQAANQQLTAAIGQLQLPQVINNNISRVKAAKPSQYSGARGTDPVVWLFQFSQYADLENVAVTRRAKLAATHLTDKAATWWRNLVVQSGDLTGDSITWAEFETSLVSIFRPVNAAKIARDKLAVLKQTNSVSAYNFHFTELCLDITDMNEAEKLDRYVRGLKSNIRVEVELAEPTTLAVAMGKAQRIDNITYQARSTSYNNFNKPVFGNGIKPMELGAINNNYKGNNSNGKQVYKGNNNNSSKPISPLQRLSQEDFAYCQRNRLCLRCKEEGHLARYCKNQVKPLNKKAQ